MLLDLFALSLAWERGRRREMEWKEGERLSERQNVVVKVLFAAEEGGGGGGGD